MLRPRSSMQAMDQSTIDLFDCDDLSAALAVLPAPDPLSEAPAAALSRSVDPALVVGHAVPHRVVPQLLRPVLAAYVPPGGVRLATVADAAVCVAELELQEGDEVGLPLRQAAVLPLLTALRATGCRHVHSDHLLPLSKHHQGLKALNVTCCSSITTRAIKVLTVFKQMTSLNVSYCKRLRPSSLPHIATLTQLEELNLLDLKVTDDDLRSLVSLQRLRALSLSSPFVYGPGLASIAALKRLESLTFHSANLTPDALKCLTPLSGCLRRLVLHQAFRDSSSRNTGALAGLSALSELVELAVNWASPGLQPLAGLRKLRKLSLEGHRQFTDDDMGALLGLPLTSLQLEHASVVADTFQALSAHPHLTDLSLSHVTGAPRDIFFALSQFPRLRRLKAANLPEPDCLKDFASLEELTFRAWKVLPCIDPVPPSLRSVSVSITAEGPLDVAPLRALNAAHGLSFLSLNVHPSSSVGLDVFAALAALEGLEELRVNYEGPFDPSAAAHLAGMPRLRTLVLGGSNVAAFRGALSHLVVI